MTDIHSCSYYCDRPKCIKAQRDELRDKLAQPEQEPVENRFVRELREYAKLNADLPLFPLWNVRRALKYLDGYTTPPAAQRTWVGLTEQQRNDIEDYFCVVVSIHLFNAIESKLKDNNI